MLLSFCQIWFQMNPDKNTRRRQILLKNTFFVFLAYCITQVATLVARLYGLSSVSYTEILLVTATTLGSTFLFLLAIKLKKGMTTKFANCVHFGQFIIWLIVYTVWLLTLREIRVVALFFALMSLTFLLSTAKLYQSILIAASTTIIQIAGSYFAIFHLNQQGSFSAEVYYTFCFIPSALFICILSEQFSLQRTALREAMHTAEQNRDALAEEIKKAHVTNQALQKAMSRIEELASHDELTGLYNRRQLMHSLELEKKRADRSGQLFSIIMLDIDHFKHINDTFGHLKGDEILKEVAGVLKTTLRETDICARYGGEEFMLVLEHADKEKAKICAERLRQLIEARKFLQSEENFSVTASLGCTTYRPKEELSQMISRADEALYRAKNSGRNRVEAG